MGEAKQNKKHHTRLSFVETYVFSRKTTAALGAYSLG
jgi:hypothetical protein